MSVRSCEVLIILSAVRLRLNADITVEGGGQRISAHPVEICDPAAPAKLTTGCAIRHRIVAARTPPRGHHKSDRVRQGIPPAR